MACVRAEPCRQHGAGRLATALNFEKVTPSLSESLFRWRSPQRTAETNGSHFSPYPITMEELSANTEVCTVCGTAEWQADWGPQHLIYCSCCTDRGVHVGCHQASTGVALEREYVESPGFQLFCSEVASSLPRCVVWAALSATMVRDPACACRARPTARARRTASASVARSST